MLPTLTGIVATASGIILILCATYGFLSVRRANEFSLFRPYSHKKSIALTFVVSAGGSKRAKEASIVTLVSGIIAFLVGVAIIILQNITTIFL